MYRIQKYVYKSLAVATLYINKPELIYIGNYTQSEWNIRPGAKDIRYKEDSDIIGILMPLQNKLDVIQQITPHQNESINYIMERILKIIKNDDEFNKFFKIQINPVPKTNINIVTDHIQLLPKNIFYKIIDFNDNNYKLECKAEKSIVIHQLNRMFINHHMKGYYECIE